MDRSPYGTGPPTEQKIIYDYILIIVFYWSSESARSFIVKKSAGANRSSKSRDAVVKKFNPNKSLAITHFRYHVCRYYKMGPARQREGSLRL